MMTLIRNMTISPWFRLVLLLALIYGGQVQPFYHLHHSHEAGQIGYVVNAHQVEVDPGQTSGHSHDDESSHQTDHRADHHLSLHQGLIDWNLNRVQTTSRSSNLDQLLFLSDTYISTIPTPEYLVVDEDQLVKVSYHAVFRMFRGPPTLT